MAKKEKTKATKTPKNKQKMSKKKLINTICIIFLSITLIGSVAAFAIVQNVLASGNLQGIDGLESENSTVLLDTNGDVFYTLSMESGIRENIEYEQIPQVVVDAFLAIEDSRFFTHNGFDFPRFVKSLYENIKAGGIAQGGSTLTMQLVDVALYDEEEKVTFGFKEKLEQKIQEIFKSMEIESQLSKEKILENYLNQINFGGQARGIQKGAEYYFGKNVEDLTLGEAAFLAGVINAPNYYNPYNGVESYSNEEGEVYYYVNHYEVAVERRNDVLYQMYNHGYIDKTEYDLAKSQELCFLLNGITNFATEKYKAFVDTVVAEVRVKTGKDPYTTPMTIYTTMDPDAQEMADALCDGEGINWPDELFQTGFAAINNQTGEILALGGGRGFDGTKNRATIETHQIGSTAKPLIDYAPAFEYVGYSTEHTILDAPVDNYTEDGGTLYNADRTFRGEVTLKTAIGLSLNVPAYKTLETVVNTTGVSQILTDLQEMGITVDRNNFSYAMSIGGGNFDITPLQLAGAYGVFANEGNYIEPYTVKKVDFEDSSIKDYESTQEEQEVFSAETAYLMSYMLKDAVENSSYQTLVNTLKSNYTVYGKSGTTDLDEATAERYGFPAGAARDKWMVGYTDTYTVACWAGYDTLIEGQNTYLDNQKLWANVEGTVVKKMLDTLTAGESVGQIEKPSGVVEIEHIKGLYPYATATDDVDDSLMVKGLINKKFAKLDSVSPDELEKLNNMQISLSGNDVSIQFTPYPDESKLKKSDGTTEVDGKKYSIFFDKSLLFGAVRYKYEIYVNDVLVKSGESDKDSIVESLSLNNGDHIKVIGWYGYESASLKSNTVTQTATADGITSTYTVIFNSNGGSEIAPQSVEAGSRISLEYPSKAGAQFLGWYTDPNFTHQFRSIDRVNSNLVLYAKWSN